jgi:hypothetical protein
MIVAITRRALINSKMDDLHDLYQLFGITIETDAEKL